MKRHEVTDEQWEVIQAILPKRTAKTGRPPSDSRLMLNGILWILRTGSPWRDLPERFGPWQTVYDHFAKWRALGAYDRSLEALHIRLDADGAIDWDLWCIDGSSVRASRAAAAGASKKAAAVTRTSRKTTLWAAREADSAASSTWLLTVEACR
jgi:transposase